jgi:hypothetical protein
LAENITIRFAEYDDVDRIMEAIRNHWDSNHILAHNKDFFLYMFGGDGNNINMVIAEDEQDRRIVGFLGCIKYTSVEPYDISPILWKVVEGTRGFIGLQMFQFLIETLKTNLVFCTGINPKTVPIYNYFGYHTGKLDHYYRIADKKEYKIARIVDKNILPIRKSETEINATKNEDQFRKDINLFFLEESYPRKDMNYFCHRYFNHPTFHYKIYTIISTTKEPYAFFICREIETFGIKILRIVDYIGNEKYFASISALLQDLINLNNYEYIDCYCYGMSEATMNRAGLIKRTEEDKNIIPNFFEPFLCKNVDILFYTEVLDNVRIFKGDGDQDQPRLYGLIN